ncbi:DUF4350 domain-containing protein [Leekyejoonella antrihumi]|uniref:DUF4350 domain-containing protein n=1 Tax=Leekyejoonella antrihumi TaxID=1660198 RepID=UPI001646B323|nr:DUF4350 domain-containing protein [Leekyejoonella antrihumi]
MTRRRLLGWGALTLALLLVAVITVALTRTNGEPLDPDNPHSTGAQALARVLSHQGVHLQTVRDRDALDAAAPTPGTTLVVTRPELLSPSTLRNLSDQRVDRIVLIDPDRYVVDQLELPVLVSTASGSPTASGSCAVTGLDGLQLSGFQHTYQPVGAGEPPGCFTSTEDPGQVLIDLPRHGSAPQVVLFGSADVLRNDTVLHGDNAAIALRVLGQDHTLIWFAASSSSQEAAAGAPSVWPAWVRPSIIVIALAVLLLALWRGRRLGALVPEPLPVIVPANEITRSRGQLYRRAKATGRAGTILREATRTRLTAYLQLPHGCPPQTLVQAAARSSGREPGEVDRLLFGPMPEDEVSMTSIAQDLSSIERQVRPR